jgi:hypothetical protein
MGKGEVDVESNPQNAAQNGDLDQKPQLARDNRQYHDVVIYNFYIGWRSSAVARRWFYNRRRCLRPVRLPTGV